MRIVILNIGVNRVAFYGTNPRLKNQPRKMALMDAYFGS